MTSIKRYGAVLAVAMCLARPAVGQVLETRPAPLELTLEQAVTRGLAEAPRIQEAQARAAAADAAVAAREALARPTVTASSSVIRTNHVDEFGVPQAGGGTRVIFPDIPNNYHARAEMTVPLFTSGRVGALVASAEADRRAADADRRTTAADIKFEVAAAYWTLVMARERVGVLERALQRADASLGDIRARVDAGVLPPNDVLSSQAQRARQNVQLIQAKNDAALAEVDLARLVGADPAQPITTVTPVDRPTPGASDLVNLSAPALVQRASETRSERQALAERQAALRSAGQAAFLATRPQVSALAAVEPARPNARFVPRVDEWNTGWDLGVNVSWALFDGGRARADRAATLAQADALRSRTSEFDRALTVEVRQRTLDIASSQAAIDASAEAVSAATEARRVVGERFSAGVATNTELLDADVALLEAELERTRLQATLRIAEARLLRTAGDQ